jgi:hypothetical protein
MLEHQVMVALVVAVEVAGKMDLVEVVELEEQLIAAGTLLIKWYFWVIILILQLLDYMS